MLVCHQLEIVGPSTNILSRQCWGSAKRYATTRGGERTANYLSNTVGEELTELQAGLNCGLYHCIPYIKLYAHNLLT